MANTISMKLKILILVVIAVFSTSTNHSQNTNKQIVDMLNAFVNDLNNLNLESFIDNFTSNATIFYPRNTFPIERVKGKEEIESEFKIFFDNVRKSQEEPPFLNIVPTERIISVYGSLAIVSLHFKLGEEFHRRTIVLEKTKNRWLINHLHASFLIDNQ